MNRKHYRAFAEMFKDMQGDCKNEGEVSILRTAANNFAILCKVDNSAFQKEKFLEACGF